MVLDYVVPTLAQLPHVVLAALAIASVAPIPKTPPACQRYAGIAFHLASAVVLLLVPGIYYGPTVVGHFDTLHSFAQRIAAPFHLGFAVFNFMNLHDGTRVDPVVHFAKAITALFVVVTNVATAYILYESNARGLHVASSFLSSLLLTNGVWLAVEVYQLVRRKTTVADEIDIMCKRTQRWIEGRVSNFAPALFLADAAFCFYHAFFANGYAHEGLTHNIRREFPVDGFHLLYVRTVACFSLGTAIISLSAAHFTLQHQQSYIVQRLVNLVGVLALFLYGYFVLGVYEPSLGLLISVVLLHIGYASALLKLHCHVHQQAVADATYDTINGPNRQTVFTVKKTTKSS